MFQVPDGVIMVVAATRMHRSLVDFARTPSHACVIRYLFLLPLTIVDAGLAWLRISKQLASGLQSRSSVSLSHENLMEMPVHTILEPHLLSRLIMTRRSMLTRTCTRHQVDRASIKTYSAVNKCSSPLHQGSASLGSDTLCLWSSYVFVRYWAVFVV
jgi:hypothetical protein